MRTLISGMTVFCGHFPYFLSRCFLFSSKKKTHPFLDGSPPSKDADYSPHLVKEGVSKEALLSLLKERLRE